jgi:integrase
LHVCEHNYGKQEIKWSRASHHQQVTGVLNRYNRKWTGEDVADFILISAYTGLRISDVATFHVSRLQGNGDVHIRATKNGEWIDTWVPEWLQERIRNRAKRVGSLIFGEHQTTDMDVITDVWRRKLKAVWALCGEWKEKPTHHRFRHTFVRILLQRGVSFGMVADLIGDTEEMVRKHYSKWVPERQDHVRTVLRDAFKDVPTATVANVIAFPR